MAESRLEYLFNQYIKNLADQQEMEEFRELIEQPGNDATIDDLLGQFISNTKPEMVLGAESRDAILQAIYQAKPSGKVLPMKTRFGWKHYIAAASITLIVAFGGYIIFNKNTGAKPTSQEQIKTDIAPGHDGAILTLADGSKIVLDDAKDGKITDVAVKDGNKVSYKNSDQSKVEYNTMTTPKGRQFSLVLPDGTQVWLNAASSITYPTTFAGNERKVSITGEAYFEVAHDASKPFHVDVNDMDVQVLGTHFNINSYSDEAAIKTTLLQGSIKITAAGKSQFVKPGQQAQVTNDKGIKMISDADVEQVMAWKNGYFSFKNADIRTVMRQLSRWYDIEIVFNGAIPNQQFNGEIGRQLTLKEVLEGLAFTSQHFKIEDGKKLIILP